MMACLFRYNMDVGLLIQYLGNSYTGAYRDIGAPATLLASLDIDPSLIQHYTYIMSVVRPKHLVADTTHDNAVQY